MSFSNQVREALRGAGVPVATHRHPHGVIVRGTPDGVTLTFRPLIGRYAADLAEETVDVLRRKPWVYNHVPRTAQQVIVQRPRRQPEPTPPPPGG